MTERKWTKGSWVVVTDDTAAQVTGFPCIYAHDYTVVGTEGMFGDIETDFANAHLIAAAPDLYEALEMALTDGVQMRPDTIHAAKAALAKARGET